MSEVGTGVVVLTVVWIVAFVLGAILLKASGIARLGVIFVFLLAVIITLVLVFFPRGPAPGTAPTSKEVEIVDTLFIGRYVLLTVASSVFLVALFLLLPFHFLDPVYAKALRTH